VLRALSPAGRRGRLTIVNFHRVHAHPDPLYPQEMHAVLFRQRMCWLREWFNVIPLADAVGALEHGTLPERALAVTFDDGYADNATVALPILRELGLHATFFIAASFIDGGRMWNDTIIEAVRAARGPILDLSAVGLGRYPLPTAEARREAIESIVRCVKYLSPQEREASVNGIARNAACDLASNLMMSTSQLRSLAASGMGIGAHTMSHPILCSLDDVSSQREIAEGREVLEALLGQPVTLFAYPNGKPGRDYRKVHVRIVRDLGFAAAVSTARGAAATDSDRWQLPRFAPWDRTALRYGLRLAHNLRAPVAQAQA
jgi:peptidoglycan/xylan/chitin deacetylase (PgdA/CDA1 family)